MSEYYTTVAGKFDDFADEEEFAARAIEYLKEKCTDPNPVFTIDDTDADIRTRLYMMLVQSKKNYVFEPMEVITLGGLAAFDPIKIPKKE